MKTTTKLLLALLTLNFGLGTLNSEAQNIGINSTGAAPNTSALLDVDAAPTNNKGLLIPRVALTQTTSNAPIGVSIATSLLVYNTATINDVTPGYYYWDGTQWVKFNTGTSSGNFWSLTGNAGTSALTNFLGTTDDVSLSFRVNNQRSGFISRPQASTFLGYNAGRVNTAVNNTFIGYFSAYNNTSGGNNVSVGTAALFTNVNGSLNTAVGTQAMYYHNGATALYNTAVGYKAIEGQSGLTIGGENTAIGTYALRIITSGNFNTACGKGAGDGINAGSYNTTIGYQSSTLSSTTNSTALGSNAASNINNKIRLGNASITVIEGQVAYTFPSDARFKENIDQNIIGLDFIMKLQPVSYNFNRLSYAKHINEKTEGRETELAELSKKRTIGFLAQDVEKIVNEIGFNSFDAVHAPENSNDTYGISYAEFVVPLVKAVQEQQAIIEKQKVTTEKQQVLIEQLIKEIELLKK